MHSLPPSLAGSRRCFRTAETFCRSLEAVKLFKSIFCILMLDTGGLHCVLIGMLAPSVLSRQKTSPIVFVQSAIGTSTDPHRASLVIAGSDQMRFTLAIPCSLSSIRVSLTDIVQGIQLCRGTFFRLRQLTKATPYECGSASW